MLPKSVKADPQFWQTVQSVAYFYLTLLWRRNVRINNCQWNTVEKDRISKVAAQGCSSSGRLNVYSSVCNWRWCPDCVGHVLFIWHKMDGHGLKFYNFLRFSFIWILVCKCVNFEGRREINQSLGVLRYMFKLGWLTLKSFPLPNV